MISLNPKNQHLVLKVLKTITKLKQKKRVLSTINVDCDSLAKKSLSHGNDYNPRDGQVWPFKFYSVDEQWQHNACTTLALQFVISNRLTRPGGPNVELRPPNNIKRIRGDGNCLFRSFSYIITGSEEQHMGVTYNHS